MGIALADGTEVAAARVVANVDPKLLYLKLIDAAVLDADFRRRIEGYRCASATFRMNVALEGCPSSAACPDGAHCVPGSSSRLRWITWSAPTSTPGRADGRASRSSNCSFPRWSIPRWHRRASTWRACSASMPIRELPEGRSWDEVRDEVADLMLDNGRCATRPASAQASSRAACLSPLDLEREFGSRRRRHLPWCAGARPAVFGAGRCSVTAITAGRSRACTCAVRVRIPGGGVTGVPGHNAAREILRDARRRARTGMETLRDFRRGASWYVPR